MNTMKILALAAFLTVASYGSALATAVTVGYDYNFPYTVVVGAHASYTLTVKPSKNVTIAVSIDANNIGYTAGTCHKAGNKTYASSSGDTKLYSKDRAPGADCAAIPPAPTEFGATPDWPADAFTAI